MCNHCTPPQKTKLDANSPIECLSLRKLPAQFSVCTLLFSAPLPQNNKYFGSLSTPLKWGSLRPIRPTVCFVTLHLTVPKMRVSFLLALLLQTFWDCSFSYDIVYVSLLQTYDPNTWFVKLRPECSHKMCAVSLHLTTQHRQVSNINSALWPENHLTYVSLISMNPLNEVLSWNRKNGSHFP